MQVPDGYLKSVVGKVFPFADGKRHILFFGRQAVMPAGRLDDRIDKLV